MSPRGQSTVGGLRSARLHVLADLLQRNGAGHVGLREMAAGLEARQEAAVTGTEALVESSVTATELDALLAIARTARCVVDHPRRLTALAEDLRVASRLCLEEARAAGPLDARRALARRAVDLAMMAERMTNESERKR